MAWTKEEIIEVYDNNPDLTLKQMSAATGYNVSELLEILLEDHEKKQCKKAQSK